MEYEDSNRLPRDDGSRFFWRARQTPYAQIASRIGGVDDRIQHAELQFADWCLRIRMQGYSLMYCADVYVHALFDRSSREEMAGLQRAWDYFRRKWEVEERWMPGQEVLNHVEQIDPDRLPLQPALPLEEVGLVQPLVSVIIKIRSSLRSESEAAWFEALARQSYPQMSGLFSG